MLKTAFPSPPEFSRVDRGFGLVRPNRGSTEEFAELDDDLSEFMYEFRCVLRVIVTIRRFFRCNAMHYRVWRAGGLIA